MDKEDFSVVIIANGEICDHDLIRESIKPYHKIIAVDGGANHCFAMKVVPHLIIGDLDSITPETLSYFSDVPVKKYPVDKDQTDTELAIQMAIKEGATKVTLFAVLGKRMDHTLYNLSLILRFGSKIQIETEEEKLFFLERKSVVSSFPGQVISLIPLFDAVTQLSTQGLKWELKEALLNDRMMSISNICLDKQFHVSYETGKLICFMQKNNFAS